LAVRGSREAESREEERLILLIIIIIPILFIMSYLLLFHIMFILWLRIPWESTLLHVIYVYIIERERTEKERVERGPKVLEVREMKREICPGERKEWIRRWLPHTEFSSKPVTPRRGALYLFLQRVGKRKRCTPRKTYFIIILHMEGPSSPPNTPH